ncbi:hypothetical protein BX616_011061 [Lobosporangium transversale]|uniref:Uncharacterized protein n=1 Tax=Lobosporangium transversale TaxID=64571 RepID=A0A1Y2GP69_9FUNG|nr:hypothetical protein BCR41DRAFT_396531 [Lobosporangium transversale]KAF9917866.1 hypothetical protein BX616_011061 [Lobosporangium transversale]ORZ15571.1 hypothetical protein BCR41DRAFT_396531 [Lobosporangium transversale]|eukprot:XP_021881319.1 hypothetical protein BCR41DRAFT_396531 [Lobosporangium transversale]
MRRVTSGKVSRNINKIQIDSLRVPDRASHHMGGKFQYQVGELLEIGRADNALKSKNAVSSLPYSTVVGVASSDHSFRSTSAVGSGATTAAYFMTESLRGTFALIGDCFRRPAVLAYCAEAKVPGIFIGAIRVFKEGRKWEERIDEDKGEYTGC